MLKYKSKFSKFVEKFSLILSFNGYNIYDVEHSVERYKERVNLPMFYYEKLLKKAILWIIKNNKDAVEDRYIFVSKKYKFGIQLEWRRDRYTGNFSGYTATTLSDKEMNFYKYNDKAIIVESLVRDKYSLQEAKKLIKDKVGFTYLDTNNELQKVGYSIFYENGQIYYTFNIIYI